MIPPRAMVICWVSKLKGTAVFGTEGQKIGEIGDVLIDKMGHVKAYVVNVGGFLGIGAKQVALEPSTFEEMAATQARPDLPTFFMQMKVPFTKDQVKQMASFRPFAPEPSTTGLAPPAASAPRLCAVRQQVTSVRSDVAWNCPAVRRFFGAIRASALAPPLRLMYGKPMEEFPADFKSRRQSAAVAQS